MRQAEWLDGPRMRKVQRYLSGIALAAGWLGGAAAFAAAPNDYFTNAAPVTAGVPQMANSADATAEPGEPNHAFSTATHSLWWKWTAPTTARMLALTDGSSFNTVLAVYTNNPGQPFGIGEVGSNDDKPTGFDVTSWVFFDAIAGKSYYFAVDSSSGSTGGDVRFTLALGAVQGVGLSVLDYGSGQPLSSSPLTLTNPASITLMGQVHGPAEGSNFEYLDQTNRIFPRFFSQILDPEFRFDWLEIPLGRHEIRARYDTANSGSLVVDVVGSRMGFKSYTNAATPISSSATPVSGVLRIQNLTDRATGPLRVSLVGSATNYRRDGTPAAPSAEAPLPEFTPVALSSLAAGSETNVAIPENLGIICPVFEGSFSSDGVQHHVKAVLEEKIGTGWSVVDRATLVSSFPDVLFPPNQGVTGKEAPTNNTQYSYLTGLGITGPLSIEEGGAATFTATVTNSLNETGAVVPVWSVPPPHSVAADGTLTAAAVTADTQVPLVAVFQRSIFSVSATQWVQIVHVSAPVLHSPVLVGTNLSFVLSGAPNKQHVIVSSPDLFVWVRVATNSTDATGNRQFSIPVDPGEPVRYFRAFIGP